MSEQLKKIDVVMPTWDNDSMANISRETIVKNTACPLRFYKFTDKTVNHGWMGGCNEGITESLTKFDSEYILLTNDDILVCPASDWAEQMIKVMEHNKQIGAVAPLSNRACGWGTLNASNSVMNVDYFRVPFLSGFFVLYRKEALKKTGILDENLPGGDDLDISIRLNDSGYYTVVTPRVFVWHHYAQTGKRIYGDYWDSEQHSEKINHSLIRKHGFKKFIHTMSGAEIKEG